jgi:CRISPR-associated protein Csm3
MPIKLEKKVIYTGTITLKTGLHIGGTNASLNIGGPDKFVVRNPITNIPYIPGSSLKGKMRALVEIYNKCISIDKKRNVGPSKDPESISGKLFGVSADSKDDNENKSDNSLKRFASHLIVRDADLDIKATDFSNTDLPYTESKTEVAIDRVTAKANPRTFERVPAGAKFKLNMVLNVFEGEDEKALKATLKQAIKLLEDDYLGGHGSRGYGQVKIDLDNEEGESKTY